MGPFLRGLYLHHFPTSDIKAHCITFSRFSISAAALNQIISRSDQCFDNLSITGMLNNIERGAEEQRRIVLMVSDGGTASLLHTAEKCFHGAQS